MSNDENRNPGTDARQEPRGDKAKVWRAPRLEVTSIAAATAAKGGNPVEVSPATGPRAS